MTPEQTAALQELETTTANAKARVDEMYNIVQATWVEAQRARNAQYDAINAEYVAKIAAIMGFDSAS